jgi:uncharacterized protein YfaT (DUF1175 family)
MIALLYGTSLVLLVTCRLVRSTADGIFVDCIGLQPYTSNFPRADIHDLLSPDLLHQLIKGTFKDHLVEWVQQWAELTTGSVTEGNKLMDKLDRR